ncbi:MAG: 50S ribosomal protein L9 [Alphaproteobacteria bacterium]|jgi:large subunit ribosomal protein L9|nr:50S ribosomal protein L9 [Alphaproteobacteria bacterium]
MDVILLERIEKLGQMGDTVKVKPGFARNYLLPQKKALRATKENLAHFQARRAQLETQNLERKAEAERVAQSLDGTKVVLIRQAGETGQLYGSVSAKDIADALGEAGFDVDRKQVQIDTRIKTLGLFDVRVVLHPEVVCTVGANVARSVDEAQMQEQRGGMITAEQAAEEAIAEDELEEAAEAGLIQPVDETEGEAEAAETPAEDDDTRA